MTYARSRLWVGISAVGSLVVLCSLSLAVGLPGLLPAERQPLATDALWVATILTAYSIVHWPFDYVGGYHLPCHYGRICHVLPAFVWASVRATLVQIAILTGAASAMIAAGREQGRVGAIAAAAGVIVFLLAFQLPIAQAVGGLHRSRADLTALRRDLGALGVTPPPILVLDGIDQGFSGGVVGLPGFTRIVIPAHWLSHLPSTTVAAEIVRRTGALATGSRNRGLLLAAGWNLGGLWLSSGMPSAGFESLAQFFTTACWFTLWSFLGLLVLPSFSRPAVLELDGFAKNRGISRSTLDRVASDLDQMQDDEPRRAAGIETIFHPIPSVERRRDAWDSGQSGWGAWHAARMALYFSWGCFGLLGRAVHCNSGRPELWVMLPAD